MSSSPFHVVSLDFPIDVVRKCPGVSLDIGGSVVKLAYRNKEDWEAAQAKRDASVCPLRLLTCARPHLDAALAKVKAEAFISREDGQPTKIYSCGLGGFEYNDNIKTVLDVEVENLPEGDCLVAGLEHMLKNLPMKDSLHEMEQGLANKMIDEQRDILKTWMEMSKKSTLQFLNPEEELNIVYPAEVKLSSEKSMAETLGDALYPYCVLQLGSAYAGLLIEKDSSVKVCYMNSNGGRHFMGIASLLTGIKSYDEFIDLTEKGNIHNVSQTLSAMVAKDAKTDKDDPYAPIKGMDTENAMFSFGHTVFKDLGDFRREDLALAWLLSHIDDITQSAHAACVQFGVKNFLVGGSFALRETVRKLMVQKMAYRDCQQYMAFNKQFLPQLYFLKNGGHTGSVGAMLNSIEKFTKDREETATPTKDEA